MRLIPPHLQVNMMNDYSAQRTTMVDTQIRPSDVTDEKDKEKDNARHSKISSDDQKFNELINNVNFILYYLTKVEIERAQ